MDPEPHKTAEDESTLLLSQFQQISSNVKNELKTDMHHKLQEKIGIMEVLELPQQLLKPLKFEQVDRTKYVLPRVLTFGLMGQGKSTSCNYILRESFQDESKKTGGRWFKGKKSTSAVTTEISYQDSDTLLLIDTCGFDDPIRSDDENMEEIFKFAKVLLNEKSYLNGL
jgi:predicted GTPase